MEDDLLIKAKAHQQYLEKLITSLQEELKKMPEGSLLLKVINGSNYYYQYDNQVQKYIKKENLDLASALMRKAFIKKCLIQLRKKLNFVTKIINGYPVFDADSILAELPKAYQNLPLSSYKDIFPNSGWECEPYEKCTLHPNKLIFNTTADIKVRSKSEVIIVELLKSNNIPFRYEAALKIGSLTYFPDFTVLRPKDGQIMYWEHFGMINNAKYVESMNNKLNYYREHGITPWNNLITTFDSDDGVIDTEVIINVIKSFL